MAIWFYRSVLRSLSRGFAIAMLLVGTAMMALVASLAFFGALISLPVLLCLREVRRRLQSGVIREDHYVGHQR
ncbi:ACR3 family arsenite efflux pump ArsB [Microvirga lupini]|uniref:ACR3 family arsenite efflux pump ArsB n=1 Tax=Microvirga lupini TaxID=420324 RepID=A0A7W4VJ98_9HYPH|nr:hypothetical protein [Microvirga lupini]MBB3018177.1 ACR3 family arsenite efflux pump ArsB [Microvirga lupini]